ncbi:MAG: FitA-like ribbon-helix-helix domain-containing protein [Solirubrobacteraceae bacterium]
MATLTIRGLDDDTKARLRVSAARHGRSMADRGDLPQVGGDARHAQRRRLPGHRNRSSRPMAAVMRVATPPPPPPPPARTAPARR